MVSSLNEAIEAATMIDPATLQVGLIHTTTASELGVFLSAPSNRRIVAVDDGRTRAGCSELVLPFSA